MRIEEKIPTREKIKNKKNYKLNQSTN
jgi:hypothetical protein